MRVCVNGHAIVTDQRFCNECGATETEPAHLARLTPLPPFEADRLRVEKPAVPHVQTVPAWVFVALVLMALAAGIVVTQAW
ncbi:MAG: hypothetical protein QOJ09_1980 [Actinomycetota bacterium]|nr:hypothetical protein [Actinomycetota bacterium]